MWHGLRNLAPAGQTPRPPCYQTVRPRGVVHESACQQPPRLLQASACLIPQTRVFSKWRLTPDFQILTTPPPHAFTPFLNPPTKSTLPKPQCTKHLPKPEHLPTQHQTPNPKAKSEEPPLYPRPHILTPSPPPPQEKKNHTPKAFKHTQQPPNPKNPEAAEIPSQTSPETPQFSTLNPCSCLRTYTPPPPATIK